MADDADELEPFDFDKAEPSNVIDEGRLLWEQLAGIELWDDFVLAIGALSLLDLRYVVAFKVFESHGYGQLLSKTDPE